MEGVWGREEVEGGGGDVYFSKSRQATLPTRRLISSVNIKAVQCIILIVFNSISNASKRAQVVQ